MSNLRAAIVSLVLFTLICGVTYPLLVTVIAVVAFPRQASGTIIERDGKAIGSELIAQPFTDPRYFWPRPSAAGYDGASSAGSNLGPTNPALIENVKARIAQLRAADPSNTAKIPIDLVTASASGLDPDISIAAARYQISGVARARGLLAREVERLVNLAVEDRTFGLFGEPRVNVLMLNLALDAHGAAPTR